MPLAFCPLLYRSQGPQSELGDPDSQSFEPIFQPAEASSHTYSKDYGYGYSPDPPAQMDRGDDFTAPGIPNGKYVGYSQLSSPQ